MPVQAPSTIDQFLQLVRKSGLVEGSDLDAFLQQSWSATNLPTTTGKMAGALVRAGLLTHFQAEQILQGKHRGFTIGGKYKVLERLGSGGMGTVYLCEHKIMERRVAIKMLPAAQAADRAALERFHREARAAARLDHPNIVRAHDVDQAGKLHFLVMEHVDGASLQEIIKGYGPMDVLRAAHYIRQAAVGLQHAHEAGLVHRDIKPGNVLVDRTGTVKVLDMGLALFFHDQTDNLTRQHDPGSVLGTADYLAPEQAVDSHAVDIRADIYSLGATFYFLLTGKSPFSEGTLPQKLIWHQMREPESIRVRRPEVPEGLVAVIDQMMAKDPAERYQTPAEVVKALTPWTQEPIPPPPEEEMPRLSRAAGGGGAVDSQVKIGKPGSGVLSGSAVRVGAVPSPRGPMTARAGQAGSPATGKAVRPLSDSGSRKITRPSSTSPRTRVLSGQSLSGTDLSALADTERGKSPTLAETDPHSTGQVPVAPPSQRSRRRLTWLAAAAGVLLATGAAVVAYWAFLPAGTPPTVTPPEREDIIREIRYFDGPGGFFSVAFSADGRQILTGASDRVACLWDVETGNELRTFAGHGSGLYGAHFSTDGRRILSCSGDKTMRLWEVDTSKAIRTFEGHGEAVWGAALAPDGRQVLSGSDGMRLWDVETGKLLRTFETPKGAIYDVAFSPDGQKALSGGGDSVVRLWDVQTGEMLRSLRGHRMPIRRVIFSPDGKYALSASYDKTVRLWDLDKRMQLRRFDGHTEKVYSVACSPNGRYVLSGSDDKTMRLWDLESGECLHTFGGHENTVHGVAFSPDGRYALSASADKTMRLWQLPKRMAAATADAGKEPRRNNMSN